MIYKGLSWDYVKKVEAEIKKRLDENNDSIWLNLKNGKEFGIQRVSFGDVRIYDGEPNLVAEYPALNSYTGQPNEVLMLVAEFIIRANYEAVG